MSRTRGGAMRMSTPDEFRDKEMHSFFGNHEGSMIGLTLTPSLTNELQALGPDAIKRVLAQLDQDKSMPKAEREVMEDYLLERLSETDPEYVVKHTDSRHRLDALRSWLADDPNAVVAWMRTPSTETEFVPGAIELIADYDLALSLELAGKDPHVLEGIGRNLKDPSKREEFARSVASLQEASTRARAFHGLAENLVYRDGFEQVSAMVEALALDREAANALLLGIAATSLEGNVERKANWLIKQSAPSLIGDNLRHFGWELG